MAKGITCSKLTFAQANAICREFVPIGDEIYHYEQALEKAGFSAFIPNREFHSSFCKSNEEFEVHGRCRVEAAKNLLGRPWPFRFDDAEVALLYQSPYLKQLSDELTKENGVPLTELGTRYPGQIWRTEIDPCARRRVYASLHEREAFAEQWRSTVEEQNRRLGLEVAYHASELAGKHSFDWRGRYAFFAAVMERDAAPLGFVYDKFKSRPGFPVFSKHMTEYWDLCWAIEDSDFFSRKRSEGRYAPYLELRHRFLTGSVDKAESGEFLFIRYQRVVSGFVTAYGRFGNLDELETMIKAHLSFYSLIADIIENGIRKGLSVV